MTSIRPCCLVCGGDDLVRLADIASVPTLCNQVFRDPVAARRLSRAGIELVGCRTCGHMMNAAFDPTLIDYNAAYENSLLCSTRYQHYTSEIIDSLRNACGESGGMAVEIGCGRGQFLRMLCTHGFRRAIGFDPARPDDHASIAGGMVSIFGSTFDPARAPNADLVCSRHVLEHLPDPVALLRQVRAAYASRPPRLVFLEVPNGRFTLSRLGIWDLIYEHVSYFTHSSLSHALARSALSALSIEPVFGEQFLIAEATFARDGLLARPPDPPADLLHEFTVFGRRLDGTIEAWNRWLGDARRNGRKLALWGGGSKGVTFLNLLDREDERAIANVIDSNPLKDGAFIAGTGHPIASPASIARVRPDAILVMNPEYAPEIRQGLSELGLNVKIIVVSGELPPSVSKEKPLQLV